MSRTTVLDANFKRHEVADCDRCTARFTLDVCENQGWLLSDELDLCHRCRPPKSAALAPRRKRARR
jgi:hypothetical protein